MHSPARKEPYDEPYTHARTGSCRFVSCTALAEAVHNHVYGWRPDDDFDSLDEGGKAAAVKSCLDVLVRELGSRKLGILQIARQCDRDGNGTIDVTEFGHRHADAS